MAKKAKLEIEVLDESEVLKLIGACSRRAPTGTRNSALLSLLYGTGARISEALDLRPRDLDLDALTVRIHHGKGDRARTSFLFPMAVPYVQRWLDRRRELGIDSRRVLFSTLEGGRMDASYVRHLLKRLKDKVGLEKRLHPHGFRHSHASRLRADGANLHDIQEQLGHEHTFTTFVYLKRVGNGDGVANLRKLYARPFSVTFAEPEPEPERPPLNTTTFREPDAEA